MALTNVALAGAARHDSEMSLSSASEKIPPPDPIPQECKAASPATDVQMLSVAMSLQDVAHRLSSLEANLGKPTSGGSSKADSFIKFAAILFGGWPALGFLFLLLFYGPLREALNAFPEKVKGAQEIGVLGVSLKSTIRLEAARLGAGNLSETIPRLSSAAIELLLRAPQSFESLVSYTLNDRQEYEKVHFPDLPVLDAIAELEKQGLVVVEGYESQSEPPKPTTVAQSHALIDAFRKKHSGRQDGSSFERRATWIPNAPLPRDTAIPYMAWRLTDLGRKATDVILKAVSTELAPTNTRSTLPEK